MFSTVFGAGALVKVPGEFPTLEEMSQRLKMGSRTLRRRLVKENLTYQQILDDVRYRLAREYLHGTILPVTEIAELLGFSDAANFRRSFRRWSDKTPSQFRMSGI